MAGVDCIKNAGRYFHSCCLMENNMRKFRLIFHQQGNDTFLT